MLEILSGEIYSDALITMREMDFEIYTFIRMNGDAAFVLTIIPIYYGY